MNEIQLNTLLGNFWEEVVAGELTALGVSYDRSPQLGEGIISPDFVCRAEGCTIFVTCTSTRESFIKKRWRYFNELFQAKAVLGERMFVVNLVLSTNVNLQGLERLVFEGMFDASVFGDLFSNFELLTYQARSQLEAGEAVRKVYDSISASRDFVDFGKELRGWLKNRLKESVSKFTALWTMVVTFHASQVVKPFQPHAATYWRRACLRLLPLSEPERNTAIESVLGRLVIADPSRFEAVGLTVRRAIGGRIRISDEEIGATLVGGFEYKQLLRAVADLEKRNDAIVGFPLAEVVDKQHVVAAYGENATIFTSKLAFISKAIEQFHDPSSRRIKAWEYGVALAESSVLDFNKHYVQRWGHCVVANPINNVILKTEIADTISANYDIDEMIERASEILWARIPRRITQETFVERVMEYRRRSLFLQPYLNPTQAFFEETVERVTGQSPILGNQECLLGDVGISGRASRVEALYEFQATDKRALVKVLSGYKGGYEHKAEEMASRAWLLRFRIDSSSQKPFKEAIRLVFVYEGEWDMKYLSLLQASGWDEVYHLSETERFADTLYR